MKRVILSRQLMYLLMLHDYCLSFIASFFPLGMEELLKKFEDVLPKDPPHGLPLVRGIEHQIDLMSGISIPNRSAYRSNPKKTKKSQRQVKSLMEKG